ncbi:multiprotein-bridging factor 1 family protein [Streptococcus sp. ZJ93]|uniref:helix-turn-helix domain-containing protein n=1 Tax=Streptococcus handemini TaxID=3161188 RepID=UPI0034D74433
MIENFKEYLYKQVGKRVRDYRENKDLNQLAFIMRGERIIGISPSRLSSIENGKFLNSNVVEELSKHITKGDQFKLLFGSDEDLKDLLSMLLYTLLLNGEKPQPTDDIGREFVNIEYNKKYEELSNILIKFMLFHPEFNQEFIAYFLYRSIAENEKNKRDELLEQENEKMKKLLESNSGNFIKEVVSSPIGTSLLTNAFNVIIDDLVQQLFPIFKEKLQQLIYDNEIPFKASYDYDKEEMVYKDNYTEYKLSPKLSERFKFEKFILLVTNLDVVIFLNNLFFKQTLDKDKNIYYLSFISQYQLQSILASNLSNLVENTCIDSEDSEDSKDSVENNPLFSYYNDLTKITDYYLNPNPKSVIPLYVPACPWDIYDDSLDNP